MVKLLKFFVAASIAGTYELWRAALPLWMMVRGRVKRVDDLEACLRLDACERCPIYYKPLCTCGSLFRQQRQSNGRPLGCLCFMPYKVKTECNCWLWEQRQAGIVDIEAGWTDALNSDYKYEAGQPD